MATDSKTFTIAVEGCCHGALDDIYGTLKVLEAKENKKIDLLICCGDFQAVRNLDDLETMSVPKKYRELGTFYKYYTGEVKAPYPTLFIGGNHEVATYLWELYYGGWAAPNIFFLGYSGVIKFGGQRIAGLSGIYSAPHYFLGHYERSPYSPRSVKSAYHVRELEVYRLMQLREQVDIFLSHDWPQNIVNFGDKEKLLKRKPYFRKEVERGDLGSPCNQELLRALQPSYWFSAHMHVKFPAVVRHEDSQRTTRFLALDKCLPGREFLQVVELPLKGPLQFEYDPEWLAILRTTHGMLRLEPSPLALPARYGGRKGAEQEDREFIEQQLKQRGTVQVPNNFQVTAPGHQSSRGSRGHSRMPPQVSKNPQTLEFLALVGKPYNLDPEPWSRGPPAPLSKNPEEIDIDFEEDEDEEEEDPMFSAPKF